MWEVVSEHIFSDYLKTGLGRKGFEHVCSNFFPTTSIIVVHNYVYLKPLLESVRRKSFMMGFERVVSEGERFASIFSKT